MYVLSFYSLFSLYDEKNCFFSNCFCNFFAVSDPEKKNEKKGNMEVKKKKEIGKSSEALSD